MDNKEKSNKILEIYRKALEKINRLRREQVERLKNEKDKK